MDGPSVSGLSSMLNKGKQPMNTPQGIVAPNHSSPSSNPHAGLHPHSFGPNFPLSAFGTSSSNGSSSMGMSISPPYWSGGAGRWGTGFPPGSYVGSSGMMGTSVGRDLGTSFGRERDRELEATYVRDFNCCGRRLRSLHELLEHYEEEHSNLPPEVRIAAINAAQLAAGQNSTPPRTSPINERRRRDSRPTGVLPGYQSANGIVPAPPGMMDIEMDESTYNTSSLRLPLSGSSNMGPLPTPTPWAAAFRTPIAPALSVPPSLLSFTPPPPETRTSAPLTSEQMHAKALRKAQRKAEKAAAREEASASDNEGEKRFACPIEGCGKVYKQANGLKYHLTRSINSGHGNVAAMGGLPAFNGDRSMDLSDG